MVFFTCNHCGESVKKPAVEKHYNTKCKKSIFLSCMDCLKDFHENYIEHTKCITEAEKYSGKDYVPKESKNTGQKKQESWLEIVRSILTTNDYKMSPAVRGIFQKLQSYDNVPRKKAKFENFVSNSLRVNKVQAQAVWTVLEKALGKLKTGRQQAENKSEVCNEVENGNQESKELEDNSGENQVIEKDVNNTNKEKKKSKKKRLEQIDADKTGEENLDEPPKKKQKKNKLSASENGLHQQATTIVELENSESNTNVGKKSKKKDQKKGLKKRPLNASNKAKNGENNLLSKKKKTNENTKEVATTNGKKPKARIFDWNKFIFAILGKHNDEIPLKKLKTKVLKKYKTHHQIEEITWKIEKTFNKKLRKSGLLLENDIVKINLK